MKKLLITIVIVVGIYFLTLQDAETLTIPNEAIRIRVLANSDSKYDQTIKKEVSNKLQQNIYYLLKDTKGIMDARTKIRDNQKLIDTTVNETLKRLEYDKNYNINYGLNYFPRKEFKGVKYDEGYYESILVTLGKGEGKNWWCVLFPPLCLLEAEESDKVEYRFYVEEILEKYL